MYFEDKELSKELAQYILDKEGMETVLQIIKDERDFNHSFYTKVFEGVDLIWITMSGLTAIQS